jgi:glycosyltransferase involved in cell wall biosynthesis
LAATHGIDSYPRMCVFVDLDHLVAHYRWLDTSRRPIRPYFRATLRRIVHLSQWRFMKELLAECQSVVNFAAHHAEWLRTHGFPCALYIPPPTRDSVGPEQSRSKVARGPGELPRVLLIGHLGGIATISGMRIFLKQGLPRLESRLGAGTFEVHVVGDYSKHLELAEDLRQSPSVRLRGYVEDVNPEFLACDVLLVPTPINLGTRTRVIEGFSYGCCIVSHSANALGIPQLVHEQNGLLADDGAGMGDEVARALTDAALRQRLRADARRTFEEIFSLETAGARLAAELAAIARPVTAS